MTKSATEVMQDIIEAAVLDGVAALKAASKGLPNTLLRDINAIHANTTVTDLPKEVQAAITDNVRAAFSRLLKEGYAVGPRDTISRPAPRRDVERPRDPRPPHSGPARSGPPRDRPAGEGPRRPRPAGGPGGTSPRGPRRPPGR